MKKILCAIAKNENHYIYEWAKWHLELGFDKVAIIDNNDIKGERVKDVLLDMPNVEIWHMAGKGNPMANFQAEVYSGLYKRYTDADWLAFLDIDEFLNFEDGMTLEALLSDKLYVDYPILRICWKTYTDNGYVRVVNGDYSLRKRFTEVLNDRDPLPYRFADVLSRPNTQCKMLIRGGMKDISFASSHTLNNNLLACNVRGEKVWNHNRYIGYEPVWDIAWIDHYRMKTIEEYMHKLMRGTCAGHTPEQDKYYLNPQSFFRFNERTAEKEAVIKEYGI